MNEVFLKISNLEYEWSLYSQLRKISFDLKCGENVVFFGMENSGINLLFPVIAGVYDNFKGKILFKGQTITEHDYFKKNEIRKELVYLPKDFGLINNLTVAENIGVPLSYHTSLTKGQIEEKINHLIEELDLIYCRDLRPVTIRPSEALRAAYARATCLDPCMLLVEHPLEGQCLLDQTSFMKSLKKRCDSPEKSVVLLSYKPKYFIDFADRFIMLHHGEIVFDGNQEQLLEKKNPYVEQFLTNSIVGPMDLT